MRVIKWLREYWVVIILLLFTGMVLLIGFIVTRGF